MSIKTERLEKLFTALECMCAPNGASVKELTEALGCDRKTVYRVFKTMEELSIPCEDFPDYDGPTNSRRWRIPEKFLGKEGPLLLRLDREERFLLIYLLRKDKIVADSPLAPVVSSLHAKLDKLLVCSTGGEQSAVFVSDRHRRSYTGVQRKIFSVFTEAVEKHMQLAVSYQSNPDVHNVRQVKTFRLNPYTLVDYNGAFYIIGQNPEYTGLRTYSLDRFKKAEPVRPSAAFMIPAGYSPESYLDGSFGIVCDCEPVHVRIEFPWWSRAAIENRTWGKEQTVEELPDGGCILSFTTSGKFDLLSWIRSFGSDIRVLEPESIRSEIIADLKRSLVQYEDNV